MGRAAEKIQAFAYLRTSSAANVGEDRDSDKRQAAAIEAHAKRAGIEIVDTFYDAAVRGGDPIDTRPGFAAMLERIEGNGVRTIVVETANRFARDLMVQEVGFAMLQKRGIDLIAADSPTSFLDDTPTARLIRQVLGAVSEFEKAMVVAKLRGARDRKRKTGVKVEGRKSIAETKPAGGRAGPPAEPESPKRWAANLTGDRGRVGEGRAPHPNRQTLRTGCSRQDDLRAETSRINFRSCIGALNRPTASQLSLPRL